MDKLPVVLRTTTLGSEELRSTDNLSVGDTRIVDVADPVDGTDAVNLGFLSSYVTTTEHGSLLHLLEDDHPQYVLKSRLDDTGQDHMCGANMVGMPIVSGATVNNLHDFTNDFCSAGRRTGGVITDAGGATVNVTAGTGYLKANDIDTDELIAFDWAAMNGIAIPIDTLRYIGVEWNGGAPQVTLRAAYDFDLDTDFPLGVVINENDVLIVVNNPWWVTDGITNIIQRFDAMGHIVRCEQCGGLILGTSGVRNITLSGGQLWSRFNDTVIPPIDTSAAGDFTLYYKDNTDDWHIDIGETQYPITDWNDTTQAPGFELVAMGANKYANWWVYILFNGSLVLIYPQAEYNNAASAEAESPPSSLPEAISHPGLLVGRIIFKEGVAAPILVQSAFTTVFAATLIADHGSLAGLGDDDHAQYHNDARAAIWLAANHETTYDHTDIWGAGAEDQLWTQGAAGNPVSEANLTFDGTILTSPQFGSPANIVLVPAPLGAIQVSIVGNPRGNYAVDLQGDRANVTDVADGANSVITGGQDNTNTGICSVIGGGHDNDIDIGSDFSVIVGGEDNDLALSVHSFIGGGQDSAILGSIISVIVGGTLNIIDSSACTFIGGGWTNWIVSSDYSVIVGGESNSIPVDCGDHNAIGGGDTNILVTAITYNGCNAIGGGQDHSIQGDACVICGGDNNDIVLADGAQCSTICGGYTNIIASDFAIIGSGSNNDIGETCTHSCIVGGFSNAIATSTYTFMGGGYDNTIVASTHSVIVGGETNIIPTGCGTHNFIGGGEDNLLVASATNRGDNVIVGGRDNSIQGENCLIAGGDSNTIALAAGAHYSSIVGGQNNDLASDWAVISGGFDNNIGATCDYSTISGGDNNNITTSDHATICGGDLNSITGSNDSVICGGDSNVIPTACGLHNIIGGGNNNVLVAGATYFGQNVIAGGYTNSIQGKYCFIGGGNSNDIILAAGVNYGTICGGYDNSIDADYSCIVGGDTNSISGTSEHCFIGGGNTNSIFNSSDSVIVGGNNNAIPDGCATNNFIGGGGSNALVSGATYNGENVITGGDTNSIQGRYCTISGGDTNGIALADGAQSSTISGGQSNSIASDKAVICGGYNHTIAADSDYAAIVGGDTNSITTSNHSFIGGGDSNTITASTDSVIVGGDTNIIPVSCGDHNFIGGGNTNLLVAAATYNGWNVIVGGRNNSIQGKDCVIVGGDGNTILLAAGCTYSFIGCGYHNHITSNNASIIGGFNSVVSATGGIVVGGQYNTVTGVYGSTIGGYANLTSGNYGVSIGYRAIADKYGQLAQASGRFTATGDAQTSILIARNQTTNDTPTELFLDGAATRLAIPINTSWYFTIKVIARQTNDDFTVNGYHYEGLVTRDAGNVSVPNQAATHTFENDFGWVCAVSADVGNQALIVTVTGAVANNINWVAKIELVETTG